MIFKYRDLLDNFLSYLPEECKEFCVLSISEIEIEIPFPELLVLN